MYALSNKKSVNAFEGQMCEEDAVPHQLKACDGVEDPISAGEIPSGQGYCMNGRCYSRDTINKLYQALLSDPSTRKDPFTRIPYTEKHLEAMTTMHLAEIEKQKKLEEAVRVYTKTFIERTIIIRLKQVIQNTTTVSTQQTDEIDEIIKGIDDNLVLVSKDIEEYGTIERVKALLYAFMKKWLKDFNITFRELLLSNVRLPSQYETDLKSFLIYYAQSVLRMDPPAFWNTLKQHDVTDVTNTLRVPIDDIDPNPYLHSLGRRVFGV